MTSSPTIAVTLSADLLNHLRHVAQIEDVPLNWLVVGLVCDSIETWNERVGQAMGVECRNIGGLTLAPRWS